MQGPGSFGVVATLSIISGLPGQGLFVYQGAPARGNLIASIVAFNTTDLEGNTAEAGVSSYVPGTGIGSLFVQMSAGRVFFGSHDVNSKLVFKGSVGGSDSTVSNPTWPSTFIQSPSANPGSQAANTSTISLLGSNNSGSLLPRIMLWSGNTGNGIPVATTADVEVRGTLAVTPIGAGTIAFTVQVTTDTNPRFTTDDTGLMLWGPGNAAGDINLFRSAAGILKTTGEFDANTLNIPTNSGNHLGVDSTGRIYLINAVASAGATKAIGQQVGDTQNRWQIDESGRMSWGSGSATPDTDLFRGFAGALQTDSIFRVQNNVLQIQGAAAGNTVFQTFISADTIPRMQIDDNGKIQWGPGGSGSLDTDLYRDAGGGRVNTDGAFLAIGALETEADVIIFQAGSTNPAVVVQAIGAANPTFETDCNGKHTWGVGGATAVDTTIYRSSAGVLGTDTLLRNVSGAVEVWHSLGSLAVTGITTTVARYRLLPDGDVEIDVQLASTAAVATFSQAFPNALPAAYQPTSAKICAIAATGTNWTISASRLPNLSVAGSVVTVNMPAIAGAVGTIGCTFRYPVN